MPSFKIQYQDDIRRKTSKSDLSFDQLKKIVHNTFLNPEKTYKFQFSYEDKEEDQVTIADTADLLLAFEYHNGEVLKIFVEAEKVDLKEEAYRTAFKTGFKLLDGGQPEESIAHFAEALKHKKDPYSAYNIACAFSLLNNAFESLKWLTAAVDLGYSNWLWAVRDPDLENIRDTEEFQHLIHKLRAKSSPCSFFRRFCSPGEACGPRSCSPRPAGCGPCGPCPPRSQSQQQRGQSEQAASEPRAPVTEPEAQPKRQPTPEPTPEPSSPVPDWSEHLAQLSAMGFVDDKYNTEILARHGGDIVKTVHTLLFESA